MEDKVIAPHNPLSGSIQRHLVSTACRLAIGAIIWASGCSSSTLVYVPPGLQGYIASDRTGAESDSPSGYVGASVTQRVNRTIASHQGLLHPSTLEYGTRALGDPDGSCTMCAVSSLEKEDAEHSGETCVLTEKKPIVEWGKKNNLPSATQYEARLLRIRFRIKIDDQNGALIAQVRAKRKSATKVSYTRQIHLHASPSDQKSLMKKVSSTYDLDDLWTLLKLVQCK